MVFLVGGGDLSEGEYILTYFLSFRHAHQDKGCGVRQAMEVRTAVVCPNWTPGDIRVTLPRVSHVAVLAF